MLFLSREHQIPLISKGNKMKILFLLIGLLLSFPVYAEEVSKVTQEKTVESNTNQTADEIVTEAQTTGEEIDPLAPEASEDEKEAESQTISVKQALPSCDDEKLLEEVSLLLQEYDEQNPAETLYAKRQRLLQLKYTQNYEEEQVAGFTSAQNSDVADKLLMTKINEGLDDDEIRLCKSKKVENSRFKQIYVIVYPGKEGAMHISILNFKADGSGELSSVWGE
jgi:hypothetical protein